MAFNTNVVGAPYPLYSNTATPTAHGIPVVQLSPNPNLANLVSLVNNQALIGVTGADPIAQTLFTPYLFVDTTGTTQALAPFTSYYADDGANLVIFTLPTVAAIGTPIIIYGVGSGTFKIAQNALQSIITPNGTTTIGTGGSLSSTAATDVVLLMCTVANVTWRATILSGNFTGI